MASEIQDIFICPISYEIFDKPLLAEDGHFYNESHIKEWLKKKSISPLTNKHMSTKLQRSYAFEHLLDLYKKNKLGCISDSEGPLDHVDYCDNVDILFKKKMYHLIYKYKNFDTTKLADNYLLKKFLIDAPAQAIKYFIDNVIDYEANIGRLKLIHMIIKHCTLEIIMHLASKDVDLESLTPAKWTPLHFAIKSPEEGIVKFLIDKGVNIECETDNGWRPLHLICHVDSFSNIEYFLTHKPKLDVYVHKYAEDNVQYGPKELIVLNENLNPAQKVKLISLIEKLENPEKIENPVKS